MTENKRIVINTLVTYCRSIVSLGMNLFSSRWILEALGQTDFGLYGVVGSILAFITFFNTISTGSVSRFYADTIGHGRTVSKDMAGRELRQWFNTALFIHVALPVAAIVIGYPICAYVVKHCLVIPPDRVETCIWVLRLSFVSVLMTMISVPYVAMFSAHLYIVEVAVFNVLRSIYLFVGSYALLYAPGDRLLWYAVIMMTSTILIDGIFIYRARTVFHPCRIRISMMFNARRLRDILVYASAKFVGGLGWIVRGQGSAILVNRFFGPQANAAFGVAQQVSAQATSFAATVNSAVSPALFASQGAGDRDRMSLLAFQTCKFDSLLVVLFSVPLVVELDYILNLWLKTPPANTSGLCICMLMVFFFGHLTMGHQSAILAQKSIVRWQVFDAVALILTLPLGWAFVCCGWGVVGVGCAFVVSALLSLFGQLYFAKKMVAFSILKWIRLVFVPVICVIVLSAIAALGAHRAFGASLLRLGCVCAASTFVSVLSSYCFVLDANDRRVLQMQFSRILKRRTHYVGKCG